MWEWLEKGIHFKHKMVRKVLSNKMVLHGDPKEVTEEAVKLSGGRTPCLAC